MDTFMDKLAQKLTAQEIIRGNLAAEAVQMDELKEQVKDYEDCVEQVKALSQLMESKLAIIKESNNLAEVEEEIDRLRRSMDVKLGDLPAILDEKLTTGIGDRVSERIQEQLVSIPESLDEKFQENVQINKDNLHKECVKVYRNVQAVVVEESNKQIVTQSEEVRPIKAEVKKAVIFSLVAMVAAIGGLAVQIIGMFI